MRLDDVLAECRSCTKNYTVDVVFKRLDDDEAEANVTDSSLQDEIEPVVAKWKKLLSLVVKLIYHGLFGS